MGDFKGLIPPGLFLMAFGIRWTYCILMRYYLGRKETAQGATKPRAFRSSLLFPSSCNPGLPIEACILLGAVLLQFVGELVIGWHQHGSLGNGQHITVLFFCSIAFTTAMLQEYRIVTMPNLDYALTILAVLVKVFILCYTTNSLAPLEVQLQMDIVHLCIILAVFLTLEAAFPPHPIVPLIRCLTVTLLGSWLFQIALILYFPFYEVPWDLHDMKHMDLATMMFTWHVAGTIIFVFAMTSFVMYRVRNMSSEQVHEALDITYYQSSPSQGGNIYVEKDKYLVIQCDDKGL